MENEIFATKLGLHYGGKKEGAFGDFLELLSGETFSLRIVNDRDFESIDIASNVDPDNWFDLALIKSLLKNEKVSKKPTATEVLQVFLLENVSSVEKMFLKYEYPKTKEKLQKLEAERSGLLFPNAQHSTKS